MNNIDEFSIAMIKPGYLQKNIYNTFIKTIKRYKLKVVLKKTILLTNRDIHYAFPNASLEYANYLLSGPVLMILVDGYNPYEKLYSIKDEIRTRYNVWGKMKNLIHTVDQGNEYHIFLENFFPELLEYKYCDSLDQNYYLYADSLNELKNICECNLKYIAINITSCSMCIETELKGITNKKNGLTVLYAFDMFVKMCGRRIGLTVYYDNIIKNNERLLSYKGKEISLHSIKRLMDMYPITVSISQLSLYPWEIDEYKEIVLLHNDDLIDNYISQTKVYKMVMKLKKVGVGSILCFRPDYQIIETEYYMDVCRLLKLKSYGGSCGKRRLGEFSVSINCL